MGGVAAASAVAAVAVVAVAVVAAAVVVANLRSQKNNRFFFFGFLSWISVEFYVIQ